MRYGYFYGRPWHRWHHWHHYRHFYRGGCCLPGCGMIFLLPLLVLFLAFVVRF